MPVLGAWAILTGVLVTLIQASTVRYFGTAFQCPLLNGPDGDDTDSRDRHGELLEAGEAHPHLLAHWP